MGTLVNVVLCGLVLSQRKKMRKHIVCLGDSNTHGYCADITDSADRTNRFNEDERWTMVLQKALGNDYLVVEEGLSGRTTAFPDPLHEGMDALSCIYQILMSHEIVDLLIIMLGTNDTKERFNANAKVISLGLDRLLKKAKTVGCWGDEAPKILVVCPPSIRGEFTDILAEEYMGLGCVQKSQELSKFYEPIAKSNGCLFFDAKDCEFNSLDCMHLTKKGHSLLALSLAPIVKEILGK